MWRRIPLSDDKSYVLSLVQEDKGHRYCVAHEVGVIPPGMVFQTCPIPGAQMRNIRAGGVALRFKLATGQDFVFGAHGEWFTEQERADMREREWSSVRWITGTEPSLPPK